MRGRFRLAPFGRALLGTLVVIGVLRGRVQDAAVGGLVAAAVLALLIVGIVWPLLVDRFTSISFGSVRAAGAAQTVGLDATAIDLRVGHPTSVRLFLESHAPSAQVEVRVVDPLTSAWMSAPTSGPIDVPVVPETRGVFDHVVVEFRCGFPLGVFTTKRSLRLPLDQRWAIAPKVFEEAQEPAAAGPVVLDTGSSSIALGGDLVRSVRPYRVGDPQHRVHWPSSARAGELMVKEFESPPRPCVVVVVDLRPDPGQVVAVDDHRVETAVSWAGGVAEAALVRGDQVVLCASEDGRPVMGEVRSALQIGRRLAAADDGQPALPPQRREAGWTVTVVRP